MIALLGPWGLVIEIVLAVANAAFAVSNYHRKQPWKFTAGLSVVLTVFASIHALTS